MGKKLPHTMVLVAAALIACAFISGYNAFYVPQTNLPRVIYTEKGTRPEGTGPSVPPHAAPSGAEQEPTRAQALLKVNINTAGAPGAAGKARRRWRGHRRENRLLQGRIRAFRQH